MPSQHHGFVIWLTGLSGAGKSTLATDVAHRLGAFGLRVEILDGDAVRSQLWPEIGFSRTDRERNVARLAFIGHLLARNGVVAVVAAISPYRASRERARELVGDFVEVHVATPLEECMRRDAKGLYAKALSGELPAFTGVGDPYEEPPSPEIRIDTSALSPDDAAGFVISALRNLGYL